MPDAALEKVPGLHEVHDCAPAAENWPAEQFTQLVAPLAAEKVPAVQVVHETAPPLLENVPPPHAVHDVAPELACALPAGHEPQVALPGAAEKDPGWQFAHEPDPAADEVPA